MRTIVLFAAFAAGLSAAPGLPAQSPAALALVAAADLRSTRSSPDTLPALPDAPRPAIIAGAALFPAPCRTPAPHTNGPDVDSGDPSREPCATGPNPYTRFLDDRGAAPLSSRQKAMLALRDISDPANLATIVASSAFTLGTNSHNPYGPGWSGLGRITGYSLLQDATGEFFGTFLIPSVMHEDPRYHRMPRASVRRRILHAFAATVLAQNDAGHTIPNYSNLLGMPICSELGNLYVPGLHTNGPSTVARTLTGYATLPADNLITEFLPDVARRIHVRVIFVQQMLNQISDDPNAFR